jgi:hypothetical protein
LIAVISSGRKFWNQLGAVVVLLLFVLRLLLIK